MTTQNFIDFGIIATNTCVLLLLIILLTESNDNKKPR
jgi:hypothetical protein